VPIVRVTDIQAEGVVMHVFPFDGHNLLFSFIVIAAIQVLFFVFAAGFRTDRLTDLSYGLTFVILSLVNLFLKRGPSPLQVLLAVLVVVWGLRLGMYLFIRILKIGRDERFDGRRENIGSFARFWALQALSIWIILLPVTLFLSGDPRPGFSWATLVGVVLWLVGFSIEALSDQQKYAFRNNPENRGKWIERGLWRYSRHPNYFGESLLWFGVLFIALPVFRGWMWTAVISPVYITLLLLFVTGIPLLEKKAFQRYGKDPDYKRYVERTSVFVPRSLKKG
jgi:steroid 5-alpha reductase family enzyme